MIIIIIKLFPLRVALNFPDNLHMAFRKKNTIKKCNNQSKSYESFHSEIEYINKLSSGHLLAWVSSSYI